jgi:hypothetical protein
LIGAVLGAVLIVVGIPFMWLVDILTLLFTGDVLWID